ncbi:23S rRNA (adenine(2030)-N(6))-methyltransferase RlmJ [Bacteroides faecium]|uniref:23S rRNA (Adenine(2030)-N(6))-methyltransferase RlmJ n=1 Tax=Bacteroides faecium TaxID=2715212 RepID=A0A6H0KHB0_9BACE|nr:23S rRNA (adenine(2030)-N(6))-methyltransferase RlmJ [Bacteroides faecium]QIU92796.1 23S rRNA (adenine(2030)-N(6))-methyltransferase RlmJ [Bacteroides faecium]
MSTYTHFAKQPDVLKHLVLCEALRNETPQVYVETNSACAIYQMAHTPEQQYGIYHFLENANEDTALKNSIYHKLESTEMAKGHYLGSPALAMNVLGNQAQRFVFFDLEKSALDNVAFYTKQIGLDVSVEVHNTDSLEGTMQLLPSLPRSSFIHIDPYEIDKKGDSGYTYLDVLIKATQLGMKCLLWYGFMTEDSKESLDKYITSSLKKEGIKSYTCVELTMNSIRKDSILCNPGILGSGILATNLSQESQNMILDYGNKLVNIYKNAKYKEYDGSLSIQHNINL